MFRRFDMAKPLRFSLVVSTIGRKQDLERFCVTLKEQTYRNFELILVDQSGGDELVETVERYRESFAIMHLRSKRGLSHGRNVGMKAATGDLISFPDDDCWYGRDLLERVAATFDNSPSIDLLSGMGRDETGAPMGRWDRQPGTITRANVWRRAISMTIFFRRQVTEAVKEFDELLGVGSGTPFGSGEETDFVIQAIDRGFASVYDPTLVVYHPNKKYLRAGLERSFEYGAGMGFVLAKNNYGPAMISKMLARPILGAITYFAARKADRASYHLQTVKGRWWGYSEGRRLARIGRRSDGRHAAETTVAAKL
jgi:glycosyltransferase involved in cell wall biosynthesis